MSSYHSSFKYLKKKSDENFGWVITHFDADNGETDSYLSQEQVYTDSYNGARRILYGTRWNAVANVKITVIKQNGKDFSVSDCREAYAWLTGNPNASWLDLYAGDKVKYSFLCTVQDVKPQKIDARTIALNIYFESISPWAYSPEQFVDCYYHTEIRVNDDGIAQRIDNSLLGIDEDGTLYDNASEYVKPFNITDDGVVYLDNSVNIQINNLSDDLYTYVYMDTLFINDDSDSISIQNLTLNEETIITRLSKNETITLNSGQFIISDIPNKIFGNSFNFVWPRLAPGINEFVISGTGSGHVIFIYRYPIKIGDCAIDIYTEGDSLGRCDNNEYGTISWDDIVNTPTTIAGYGITDAYTETEVDKMISEIEITGGTGGTCNTNIDEEELNNMLTEVLG